MMFELLYMMFELLYMMFLHAAHTVSCDTTVLNTSRNIPEYVLHIR